MIYALNEDVDPYVVSEHAEDCPEDIWHDRENQIFIPPSVLADRDCRACAHSMDLWSRIKEEVGDIRYGEIALRMIELDRFLKHYTDYVGEISASDWEFLDAIRYERERLSGQRSYQASQKAKVKR